MYRKHHLIRPAALALSLVMLGGTLPAQAASDLSGHWAEETVNRWLDAGRISGYPDDTFRPNQSMTRAEFATPYQAAKRGYVDDVIEPRETRQKVAAALNMLASKRQSNPHKKHGNFPV